VRRSRWIQSVVLVALLAAPLLLFSDRAAAIQDSEDKVWFGPVTLGIGQAVRVNAYAIGTSSPSTVASPLWTFTLRIFNTRGVVAEEYRVQAATGITRFFNVAIQDPDYFPVDRLGRRTFRAEIVGFNPQPDPPGKYAATLEVYNVLTGHTSLLLGGVDTLPTAQIVTPPGSN